MPAPASRLSPLALTGLIVLFALTLWYVFNEDQPDERGEDGVTAIVPQSVDSSPATVTPPEVDDNQPPLPSLNRSDGVARSQWSELVDGDAHQQLHDLLPNKHVVRKLTALLSAVSKGEMPSKLRDFMRLKRPFQPNKGGKKLLLGERSYKRYNPWVDILVSIDVKRTAKIYKRWSPLLESAYAELGESGSTFHSTLLRALDLVADLPLQDKPLVLVHMYGNVYRFENERIENRSAVVKLFMRSGPDNTRRVRNWARTLRDEIRS